MDKVLKVAAQEVVKLFAFSSKIEIAGSIRRKKGTYKDVDIVLIPDSAGVKKKILEYAGSQKEGNIGQGEKLVSYNIDGVEVDVYFATRENWGAMLMYLTGPNVYNIALRKLAKDMGRTLNQYGLWNGSKLLASKTEEDIYRALGKEWKSPELRGLNPKDAFEKFGAKPGQRVV